MINAIQIALTGLQAASKSVEASASNIANASTAGYTPLQTQQSDKGGQGVASSFVAKNPPFTPSYAPDSPLADAQGYVNAPNVNLVEETLTLKAAEISYKANLSVIKTADEMSAELLKSFDRDA